MGIRVCRADEIHGKPKRRKTWEVAQAVRDLYDVAKPGAEVLGVGAGREDTIWQLLRSGARVWATDIYAMPEEWHLWSNPAMLMEPGQYAPDGFSAIELHRLVVQHMDMRDLRFPGDMFDGVFSCGSIEHVGGWSDIAQAAAEIGRVLKPGGVTSIATEYKLSGNGYGWPGVVLFDLDTIMTHIVEPSGLELVGDVDVDDVDVSGVYPLKKMVSAYENGKTLPHDDVVLSHNGYVFTSVQVTMKKPVGDYD